jgi:hypothetical protein
MPGAAAGGAQNYPFGLPLTGATLQNTDASGNIVLPPAPSVYGTTGAFDLSGTASLDGVTGINSTGSGVNGLGFHSLGFANGAVAPHPMFDANVRVPLPLYDSGRNPISSAKLQLNGHDRFSEREGRYFNLVQPFQHHTNVPATGINVYSFGLKPEEHQPSGTCNMSRIDNATLQLTLTPEAVKSGRSCKVRVYATNYNVLRIMSGMGGLAYSN